jgi:hypothetical protein
MRNCVVHVLLIPLRILLLIRCGGGRESRIRSGIKSGIRRATKRG